MPLYSQEVLQTGSTVFCTYHETAQHSNNHVEHVRNSNILADDVPVLTNCNPSFGSSIVYRKTTLYGCEYWKTFECLEVVSSVFGSADVLVSPTITYFDCY